MSLKSSRWQFQRGHPTPRCLNWEGVVQWLKTHSTTNNYGQSVHRLQDNLEGEKSIYNAMQQNHMNVT